MVETIVCRNATSKQMIKKGIKLIHTFIALQDVQGAEREIRLNHAIKLAKEWEQTFIDSYSPKDGSY